MEYGKIEREIEINASPATVFEVITSPEHLTQWWPDEAVVEPTPGAVGELVFGDRSSGEAQIPQITVVEAEPPRLFSFRWVYPEGEDAHEGNSCRHFVLSALVGNPAADDRPAPEKAGRSRYSSAVRGIARAVLLPAAARDYAPTSGAAEAASTTTWSAVGVRPGSDAGPAAGRRHLYGPRVASPAVPAKRASTLRADRAGSSTASPRSRAAYRVADARLAGPKLSRRRLQLGRRLRRIALLAER